MPECRLSSTEVRVVFNCNGQGKVGEAGNDGEEESGQEGDGADSEGKRSRLDEEVEIFSCGICDAAYIQPYRCDKESANARSSAKGIQVEVPALYTSGT